VLFYKKLFIVRITRSLLPTPGETHVGNNNEETWTQNWGRITCIIRNNFHDTLTVIATTIRAITYNIYNIIGMSL